MDGEEARKRSRIDWQLSREQAGGATGQHMSEDEARRRSGSHPFHVGMPSVAPAAHRGAAPPWEMSLYGMSQYTQQHRSPPLHAAGGMQFHWPAPISSAAPMFAMPSLQMGAHLPVSAEVSAAPPAASVTPAAAAPAHHPPAREEEGGTGDEGGAQQHIDDEVEDARVAAMLGDVSAVAAQVPVHADGRLYCPHPGCERSFTYRTNLRRHLISHSDVKPFTCLECNRGFTRSDDLATHIRHHEAERAAAALAAKNAAERERTAVEGEIGEYRRMRRCNVPGCSFRTRQVDEMRAHLAENHLGRGAQRRCVGVARGGSVARHFVRVISCEGTCSALTFCSTQASSADPAAEPSPVTSREPDAGTASNQSRPAAELDLWGESLWDTGSDPAPQQPSGRPASTSTSHVARSGSARIRRPQSASTATSQGGPSPVGVSALAVRPESTASTSAFVPSLSANRPVGVLRAIRAGDAVPGPVPAASAVPAAGQSTLPRAWGTAPPSSDDLAVHVQRAQDCMHKFITLVNPVLASVASSGVADATARELATQAAGNVILQMQGVLHALSTPRMPLPNMSLALQAARATVRTASSEPQVAVFAGGPRPHIRVQLSHPPMCGPIDSPTVPSFEAVNVGAGPSAFTATAAETPRSVSVTSNVFQTFHWGPHRSSTPGSEYLTIPRPSPMATATAIPGLPGVPQSFGLSAAQWAAEPTLSTARSRALSTETAASMLSLAVMQRQPESAPSLPEHSQQFPASVASGNAASTAQFDVFSQPFVPASESLTSLLGKEFDTSAQRSAPATSTVPTSAATTLREYQ